MDLGTPAQRDCAHAMNPFATRQNPSEKPNAYHTRVNTPASPEPLWCFHTSPKTRATLLPRRTHNLDPHGQGPLPTCNTQSVPTH